MKKLIWICLLGLMALPALGQSAYYAGGTDDAEDPFTDTGFINMIVAGDIIPSRSCTTYPSIMRLTLFSGKTITGTISGLAGFASSQSANPGPPAGVPQSGNSTVTWITQCPTILMYSVYWLGMQFEFARSFSLFTVPTGLSRGSGDKLEYLYNASPSCSNLNRIYWLSIDMPVFQIWDKPSPPNGWNNIGLCWRHAGSRPWFCWPKNLSFPSESTSGYCDYNT